MSSHCIESLTQDSKRMSGYEITLHLKSKENSSDSPKTASGLFLKTIAPTANDKPVVLVLWILETLESRDHLML